MIAWRSLSSIGIAFAYLCVFLLSHGNFPCGRLAALLRNSTERVGSPGSIFELASLYGKMPLICRRGQVPRHSFTTQGVGFQEHRGPWERSCRGMGLIKNGRRKCKRLVGAWCLQPFQNLPTNGQTKQNFWTTILETWWREMRRFMVKSMWRECIRVHRSAFLCWSTRRMPTTLQPTPEIESAGKPPARALCGSPSTRSVCSESWPPDCCESTFGTSLGVALWKQGFLESKILLSDVLDARERTLGAEHPDTSASVNNLAACLDMGLLKDTNTTKEAFVAASACPGGRPVNRHGIVSNASAWLRFQKPSKSLL